jgi:hypothetical protein
MRNQWRDFLDRYETFRLSRARLCLLGRDGGRKTTFEIQFYFTRGLIHEEQTAEESFNPARPKEIHEAGPGEFTCARCPLLRCMLRSAR